MVDIRTMSVATAFVSLVFGISFLILVASRASRFPGVRHYAVGMFAGALGLMLIGLRQTVPDVVSIPVANTLILCAYVGIVRGMRSFAGEKQWPWVDFSSLLLAAGAFQLWSWPWPNVAARIAVLAGFTAFYQVLGTVVVWTSFPRVTQNRPWALAVTFVAYGAWNAVRAILSPALVPVQDFMSSGLYQALTFFPGIAWVILTGTSLLIATTHRIQRQADQAHINQLAEIEKRVARLSALNEISRAVSSKVGLQPMLETVHHQVGRVLDASNFFVATVEPGGDSWTMQFKIDRGKQASVESHRLDFGLTGYVLRLRKGLLFETVSEKASFIEREGIAVGWPESKSWMGVPLISAERSWVPWLSKAMRKNISTTTMISISSPPSPLKLQLPYRTHGSLTN